MTVIVETGTGVRDANAYVDPAFVTAYLTALGRQTENGWDTATPDQQCAAVIAATSYMDSRWEAVLSGKREHRFEGQYALGLLSFSANPLDTETVTIGTQTYTFVASLSSLNQYEVLIGATLADSIANLVSALIKDSNVGQTFSSRIERNWSAGAGIFDEDPNSILLTALQYGVSGDSIALSQTVTGATVTAFSGGLDIGCQPLALPRCDMIDRYSYCEVRGIPLDWKNATAEYAVRAHGAALYTDPTIDATGRHVVEKFEKVGPLEERTRYSEGGGFTALLKPYPAADKLIEKYLTGSAYGGNARVIR